jgi:HlyD family secretion protein
MDSIDPHPNTDPQALAARANVARDDADPASRHRAREQRRRILRAVRRSLLGLAIVAAAAVAILSLRPRPVPVDVAPVVRGPLRVVIEESGATRVKDRYLLSAPVTGSISRISLDPGDTVKEGDALAEIAPLSSPLLDERTRAEAQARLGASLSALGQTAAQIARASAAKELAEQERARAEKLAKSGALTQQEFDQADFALRMRVEEQASAVFANKIASEEVRIARVALGQDTSRGPHDQHVDVLSPVSGRILRVHQKSAGVVQAGAALIEVGDPDALEVVVDLLTTDAVQVQPGTPVQIEGWGGDHALAGRVRRLEPSGFTRPSALGVDEQRVNVIIALTDPHSRWAALADGYRVEARLVLWQNESVTKVPEGAIFRSGDGWAVFQSDGGVAHLKPVRIGHRGETEVEITSGLNPGQHVAVHPGDRVKEGARLEAR